MNAVKNDIAQGMQIAYKQEQVAIPTKIINSQDGVLIFKSIWDTRTLPKHERVYAVFLNRDREVLATELINIGGYDETTIEPRTIIEFALIYNARSVIICHNHPSGTAKPSQNDISTTKYIKNLLNELKINLGDHLIITETEDYYSFTDNKIIN